MFALIRPIRLGETKVITVTVDHSDYTEEREIVDPDDFERLIEICEGVSVNDFSEPSCGFGTVKITFDTGMNATDIYPACDGCSAMRLGGTDGCFYYITDEERAELESILYKYGVDLPRV